MIPRTVINNCFLNVKKKCKSKLLRKCDRIPFIGTKTIKIKECDRNTETVQVKFERQF